MLMIMTSLLSLVQEHHPITPAINMSFVPPIHLVIAYNPQHALALQCQCHHITIYLNQPLLIILVFSLTLAP